MDAPPSEPIRVLPLWRYTVPIHAALPLGIAALGRDHEMLTMVLMLVIHLGFPVVLAVTYPYWDGRGEEVVALIAINHVVTFTVGFGLMAL